LRRSLFRKALEGVLIWKKHPPTGQDPAALPPAVVRAILLAQTPHLEECRPATRSAKKKVSSAVVVRGEIGTDGKVHGAELVPEERWGDLSKKPSAPALSDEQASRCVLDRVETPRFPQSGKALSFVLPIQFSPNGQVSL
jgi:hypothetical protein